MKRKFEIGLPAMSKEQVSDFMLTVHSDIRDLIWIENGEYKNWRGSPNTKIFEIMGIRFRLDFGSNEPSLINVDVPVSMENLDTVDTPSYYPSYDKLTPRQRGLYWMFLKNPFAGGFDISYVFILYYGLERHLYQGNYEKAVEVILKLRKVYENLSFQTYSANAIILTSLVRKRPDFMIKLYERQYIGFEGLVSPDLFLLGKLRLEEQLMAKELMTFSGAFGFTNRNYLKKHPDIFYIALSKQINENPIMLADYISENELVKVEKKTISIYANYSINNNRIDIPAISTHPELRDRVNGLLRGAHEDVKEYLREQRKMGNTIKEVPKEQKEQRVFDEKQERKLLNDLAMAEGYIQKHYAYLHLHEFYYLYREAPLDNIILAEKYALEDICILPQIQEEYKIQQEQECQYYMKHYLGKVPKEKMAEMFNKKFCYTVPAFKRLCIIYEKEGRYQEAMKICNQALAFYSTIDCEEEKISFAKRKITLEKMMRNFLT